MSPEVKDDHFAFEVVPRKRLGVDPLIGGELGWSFALYGVLERVGLSIPFSLESVTLPAESGDRKTSRADHRDWYESTHGLIIHLLAVLGCCGVGALWR